jgi:hypothetical protein
MVRIMVPFLAPGTGAMCIPVEIRGTVDIDINTAMTPAESAPPRYMCSNNNTSSEPDQSYSNCPTRIMPAIGRVGRVPPCPINGRAIDRHIDYLRVSRLNDDGLFFYNDLLLFSSLEVTCLLCL